VHRDAQLSAGDPSSHRKSCGAINLVIARGVLARADCELRGVLPISILSSRASRGMPLAIQGRLERQRSGARQSMTWLREIGLDVITRAVHARSESV
jgi:hypothetical protein